MKTTHDLITDSSNIGKAISDGFRMLNPEGEDLMNFSNVEIDFSGFTELPDDMELGIPQYLVWNWANENTIH